MAHRLIRRDVLKLTAGMVAVHAWPLGSRAASPNEKLRTAHIGGGGLGGADLNSIASHPRVEVTALCDVDGQRLAQAAAGHPHAVKFADYRELISKMADQIDAVVVSTPDHTHAPAAMSALNEGKGVYCQKPLTHEVFEARQLRLVAKRKGVPTQMGIQVHSSEVYRRAVRMIQDGVIGRVSRVFAWSSKNWGYDGGPYTNMQPPPEYLDWNLWIGTAQMRPYVPGVYHPAQWRRIVEFGTGTLGDMGVHIFDTPYAALKLTHPKWAKTTCRPPTGIGHPEKNKVEYEFPGTEFTTESLRWTWFDGAFAPPAAAEVGLPESVRLPGQGSLFIGEEGAMLLPHVAEAVLFPEEKFQSYQRPDVGSRNHYHQWVDACLGEGSTSADFDYAGRLTEALLLGVVANRFPEQTLQWDAAAMQVTNLPDANHLLRRKYRPGFEVPNL